MKSRNENFDCEQHYFLHLLASAEYILDWYGSGFLDVDQYALLNTIAYGFLILYSIINPYLYVGSCQFYRNAVKEVFYCWK